MIRVTVSYPHSAGSHFDHDYYARHHRPLVQNRLRSLGLVKLEMDRCLADGAGGRPPVEAAAHMFFESLPQFQEALKVHGPEIMGDIPRFTDIQPQILISEVVD